MSAHPSKHPTARAPDSWRKLSDAMDCRATDLYKKSRRGTRLLQASRSTEYLANAIIGSTQELRDEGASVIHYRPPDVDFLLYYANHFACEEVEMQQGKKHNFGQRGAPIRYLFGNGPTRISATWEAGARPLWK
jgi:hypothetical protein